MYLPEAETLPTTVPAARFWPAAMVTSSRLIEPLASERMTSPGRSASVRAMIRFPYDGLSGFAARRVDPGDADDRLRRGRRRGNSVIGRQGRVKLGASFHQALANAGQRQAGLDQSGGYLGQLGSGADGDDFLGLGDGSDRIGLDL